MKGFVKIVNLDMMINPPYYQDNQGVLPTLKNMKTLCDTEKTFDMTARICV